MLTALVVLAVTWNDV